MKPIIDVLRRFVKIVILFTLLPVVMTLSVIIDTFDFILYGEAVKLELFVKMSEFVFEYGEGYDKPNVKKAGLQHTLSKMSLDDLKNLNKCDNIHNAIYEELKRRSELYK